MGSAQDFSVQLIDARNGHLLPNRPVTVSFIRDGAKSFEGFSLKTDANGTAVFRLPSPVPHHIQLNAYDLYPCYQVTTLDVTALKEVGIVSRCSKQSQACQCNFSKEVDGIKATPGQIQLFARPETFWERIQARLWEWRRTARPRRCNLRTITIFPALAWCDRLGRGDGGFSFRQNATRIAL
jgi:hypothetical protein